MNDINDDIINIEELIKHTWLSTAILESIGTEIDDLDIEPGITECVKVELLINGKKKSLRSFISHLEREFEHVVKIEAVKMLQKRFLDMNNMLYTAEETLKRQLFDAGLLTSDDEW